MSGPEDNSGGQVVSLADARSPEGWAVTWAACLSCGFVSVVVAPVAPGPEAVVCELCGGQGVLPVWNATALAGFLDAPPEDPGIRGAVLRRVREVAPGVRIALVGAGVCSEAGDLACEIMAHSSEVAGE